ncbi:MAG: hypothetical protein ACRDOE_14715 [Streptosporangiaceae bacterium]
MLGRAGLVGGLAFASCLIVAAQGPPGQGPISYSVSAPAPLPIPPHSILLRRNPPQAGQTPMSPEMAAHLLQERASAQRQALQQMTATLTQWAQALQNGIAHAGPDVVPLDCVRQAKAIEKLAKKIQGNLKSVPH